VVDDSDSETVSESSGNHTYEPGEEENPSGYWNIRPMDGGGEGEGDGDGGSAVSENGQGSSGLLWFAHYKTKSGAHIYIPIDTWYQMDDASLKGMTFVSVVSSETIMRQGGAEDFPSAYRGPYFLITSGDPDLDELKLLALDMALQYRVTQARIQELRNKGYFEPPGKQPPGGGGHIGGMQQQRWKAHKDGYEEFLRLKAELDLLYAMLKLLPLDGVVFRTPGARVDQPNGPEFKGGGDGKGYLVALEFVDRVTIPYLTGTGGGGGLQATYPEDFILLFAGLAKGGFNVSRSVAGGLARMSRQEAAAMLGFVRALRSDIAESLVKGKLGGQVLSDATLDAYEKVLLFHKVRLLRNQDKFLAKKGAEAMTQVFATGFSELHLPSNPTLYQFLHELCHVKYLAQFGAAQYRSVRFGPNGNLIHEQYVYDMLRNNFWNLLNAAERTHAQDYIKSLGGNAS
jgi:hypothetical protein